MRRRLVLVTLVLLSLTGCAERTPSDHVDATPVITTSQHSREGSPTIPTLANESWPDLAEVIGRLSEEHSRVVFADGDLEAQARRYASEASHDLEQGFPQQALTVTWYSWSDAYDDAWRAANKPFQAAVDENARNLTQILDTLKTGDNSTCFVQAAGLIHAGLAAHGVAERYFTDGDMVTAMSNEAALAGALHVASRLVERACAHVSFDPSTQSWVETELRKGLAPPIGNYTGDRANFYRWRADWATENGLSAARDVALREMLGWHLAFEVNEGMRAAPTPEEVAEVAAAAMSTAPSGFEALAYGNG